LTTYSNSSGSAPSTSQVRSICSPFLICFRFFMMMCVSVAENEVSITSKKQRQQKAILQWTKILPVSLCDAFKYLL
uniref:Ovule protein n=1 Tax=Haemonchus placei TaxID=6290 RepID=A0A0N4WL71_HAEPC